jgi:hypothetical protein
MNIQHAACFNSLHYSITRVTLSDGCHLMIFPDITGVGASLSCVWCLGCPV